MVAAQAQEDSPIGEVNTTPLIDVMLVLLVMFIITIPIQTHSVPLDLPTGEPPIELNLERNKLVVTEQGALFWNGQAIDLEQLRGTLARLSGMQPQPELQFEPHAEARYAIVGEVVAAIKRANIQAMGFVGNERYASF
jgi:biopolymer transport protein ExbD